MLAEEWYLCTRKGWSGKEGEEQGWEEQGWEEKNNNVFNDDFVACSTDRRDGVLMGGI